MAAAGFSSSQVSVKPTLVGLRLREDLALKALEKIVVQLLAEGGGHPAVATHDPWLLDRSIEMLDARGMGPADYEVEMLLGVGESLRPRVIEHGSTLRLYCPYGPHWEAFALRRLRENPQMAGHVLRQFVLGCLRR